MFFRKILFLLLLLVSPLLAGEKNSTPCFSVGELGERWELGSDHLPTGVSVKGRYSDGRHFVSWNILDKRCMRWIENNSQGLVDSAITRDDFPLSPGSSLTIREEKIIRQIVSMAIHPTHPRSVIALQETHPDVFEALKSRLPWSYVPVTTFSGDLAHGDVFFFDTNAFEMVDQTGNTFHHSNNTWMILTLRDKEDGKLYAFVQSHVPGGDFSPIARNQLAYQTLTHLNPAALTFIMGDQNRSPDYFMADLERVANQLCWNSNPFQVLDIPYPTHVNTLQEASWIDNLFVAGPLYRAGSVRVNGEAEEFFPELAYPIAVLWSGFPIKLPDNPLFNQWRLHYLKEEGNFDLLGLVAAVVYTTETHPEWLELSLKACQNLWEIGGVRNTNILIAAFIRNDEKLAQVFGPRIAQIVKESTLPVEEASQMSQDARLVKLGYLLAQESASNRADWLYALRGTNCSLEKVLSNL